MTAKQRKLPFTVNRDDARSLLDQVTDGLREAIVGGYYAPGDVLPSSHELVPLLGVSRIVTKNALARLAAEGYIASHVGTRSVVRNRGAKQWRGHVVFVGPSDPGNYFQAVFAGTLRAKLTFAGYLFTEASLSWGERNIPDFTSLDAALSRSVDLIIARNSEKLVLRHLAKCGVPFISVDGDVSGISGAVGFTRYDMGLAASDFVADCQRLGIREVVSFSWKHTSCDVVPACRRAGIKARKVMVPVPDNIPTTRLEVVRRLGMETVSKMLRKGRSPTSHSSLVTRHSSLYFFADDYLASGALLAFALAGMEAPRDFLVATLANAGIVPVYPREISRMEIDPVAAGTQIAENTLEYLRTGRYPSGGVIGPKWVRGETM